MRTYEFKAYGANWELIAKDFIAAEDRQEAELKEEMLADSLRDIGYEVKGTSLVRVR